MKLLIASIALAMAISAQAQQSSVLIPYRVGDLWGYSDIDGKIKVAATYERADLFSSADSLAAIAVIDKKTQHTLFGRINTSGKIVFPPKYSQIVSAPQDYEWGSMINEQFGKRIAKARGAKEEYARLMDSIHKNFVRFNYIVWDTSYKYALYDKNGKALTKYIYDDIEFLAFDNDRFLYKVKANKRYGVVDEKGKVVAQPIYFNIDKDRKWQNGEYKTNIIYTKNDPTENSESTEMSIGTINQEGIKDEGIMAPIVEEKKEAEGKYIPDPPKTQPASQTILEKATSLGYDTIYSPVNRRDGIMIVRKNGKYGTINQANMVLIPIVYQSIRYYKTLMSKVSNWQTLEIYYVKDSAGKCGIIDRIGRVFLKCLYDSLAPHNLGEGYSEVELTRVQNDGKWGLLKDFDKTLINPEYENIGKIGFMNRTCDSFYCYVQSNGKWGVINEKGKMIIAPRFTTVPKGILSITRGYIMTNDGDKTGVYFVDAPDKSLPPIYTMENGPYVSYPLGKEKKLLVFRVFDNNYHLKYYIGSNGVTYYREK